MSEINNSPILGKIGNIEIKNTDEKLLHAYHLDEGAGDVAYDSVGEWYGEDLMTYNDSLWTNKTNTAFTDNTIICTNADESHGVLFSRIISIGKEYKVVLDVTVDSGEIDRVYLGSTNILSGDIDTTGIYELEGKSTSSNKFQLDFGSFYGNIKVAVHQVISSPSNATINNGDETLFVTDNRFDSKQNDVGYSDAPDFSTTTSRIATNISHSDLDLTGDITIETWINPKSFGGGESGRILDTTKLRLYVSASSGLLKLTSNGLTTATSASSSIVIDGSFKHIIVTRKNNGDSTSSVNFYINDILSGIPDQNSGNPDNATDDLTIGNRPSLVANFDGVIGQCTIYDEINASNPIDVSRLTRLYSLNTTDYSDKVTEKEATVTDVTNNLIPISLTENNESTHLDIFGNVPTMDGRTKNNVKVVGNSCLEFDGEDGYVDLDEFINPESFSVVVKVMTAQIGSTKFILGNSSTTGAASTDGFSLYLGQAGTRWSFVVGDGTNYALLEDTINLAVANEWTVLSVSYDATTHTSTLKVGDNKEITRINTNVTSISQGNPFYIGKIASLEWDGLIDYVIITTPNKTYTYNFGEGAGDIVYDRSEVGYGNDINSIFDFTDWSKYSAVSSITESSFVADTSSGLYESIFTIGKMYRLTIKGSLSGGASNSQLALWNYNGISNLIGVVKNGLGEFDTTFTFTSVNANLLLRIGTSGAKVTISTMVIVEVFVPINGTLQNGCDWVTDPQASPSNLTNGFSNGLECVTAGVAYKESNPFETIEFTFSMTNAGSEVVFITNKKLLDWVGDWEGWAMQNSSEGTVSIFKHESGNFDLMLKSTIGIGVFNFKFVVTPTSITVYYKELFDDTYVELIADVRGTNPIIDGSFRVNTHLNLNLESGDFVSNLIIDGVVQDCHSFYTTSPAIFDKLYIPSQTGNTGLDVNGLALTNPAYKAGVGHNNSESKYLNYPVASLIKEDMLPGGVSDVPMKYLYGEELVTNGHFDSDSDWNKGVGWTISDGKAVRSSVVGAGKLEQNIGAVSGGTYLITYDFEDLSGTTTMNVRLGAVWIPTTSGTGHKTTIVTTTATGNLQFEASAGTESTIDNVSAKEITDITPAEISYRDIDYDKYELDPYHRVFANAEELKKRDMVIYETEQSGEALTKIYKAIKKPE